MLWQQMITRTINLYKEKYDIYIGRYSSKLKLSESIFHNPYHIGKDGDRFEVIEKYKKYFYERLVSDHSFYLAVRSLKGKTLGCYCKPQPCHGDIIAEYLNDIR
jgi:hypothetical protein